MKSSLQTVSQIGEFSLIERISQILPQSIPKDIIIGIGDDTAVIKIDDTRSLLATCDMQIEGTHFRMEHITPYQLGRRAMAVNLSDIASMGGRPMYALVSLGIPANMPLNTFDDVIKGMSDQLSEFDSFIIGGNLTRAYDKLVIDVFLLGEVPTDKIMTRAGAKSGDRIYVTGTLGGSAAGFYVLDEFGHSFPSEFAVMVQTHLQPIPKVWAGIKIAQSGFATSMIDISDGLAGDLFHICEISQVGAEIFQGHLPIPKNIDQVENIAGKTKYDLALSGGEDYELLFTVKSETPLQKIESIARETGVPITEIGRILPKADGCWLVDSKGNRQALQPKGWNHFI